MRSAAKKRSVIHIALGSSRCRDLFLLLLIGFPCSLLVVSQLSADGLLASFFPVLAYSRAATILKPDKCQTYMCFEKAAIMQKSYNSKSTTLHLER